MFVLVQHAWLNALDKGVVLMQLSSKGCMGSKIEVQETSNHNLNFVGQIQQKISKILTSTTPGKLSADAHA